MSGITVYGIPGSPFLRRFQVFPPSVVLMISAATPIAVPLFASVKDTPWSKLGVPLVCGVQVLPPSVERETHALLNGPI